MINVFLDLCLKKISTKKKKRPGSKHQDGGRHQDEQMMHWFNLLIMWFESESGAELYTLSELHSKMAEFSDGSNVYSMKRLKQKLQEHYQDYIFFANIEGRDNVICFRNMAEYVINQKWQSKRNDTECEAEHIVTIPAT